MDCVFCTYLRGLRLVAGMCIPVLLAMFFLRTLHMSSLVVRIASFPGDAWITVGAVPGLACVTSGDESFTGRGLRSSSLPLRQLCWVYALCFCPENLGPL